MLELIINQLKIDRHFKDLQIKNMKQTLDMIRIKSCENNWDSIRKLAEEGLEIFNKRIK